MITTDTKAAIRTTYLSSIMQGQRRRLDTDAKGSFVFTSATDHQIRQEARDFVLWCGANRNPAGLIDMWYVPEISAEQLNAVMDEVDAEG